MPNNKHRAELLDVILFIALCMPFLFFIMIKQFGPVSKYIKSGSRVIIIEIIYLAAISFLAWLLMHIHMILNNRTLSKNKRYFLSGIWFLTLLIGIGFFMFSFYFIVIWLLEYLLRLPSELFLG